MDNKSPLTMMYSIACLKDNKCIGYWYDWKIRRDIMPIYKDTKKLDDDFKNASAYIPAHWEDEVILPVIIMIDTTTETNRMKDSLDTHLSYAKKNWINKPERIAAIENAINNIKALN